jgi:hypothetical protein
MFEGGFFRSKKLNNSTTELCGEIEHKKYFTA